jgi:predicted metal-dependent peptidase
MTERPEHKLTKARAGLVLDNPFFGALALRLTTEEKPGLDTVATDGRKLYWDRRYVQEMSLDELKTLWAEEVLHCGLAHHLRRGNRDMEMWNLSCDQAIFHILKDSGFTLPRDCSANPAYKGKSAEEIFTIMSAPKKQDGQGGGAGGGQGQQQGQGKPGRQPGQGYGQVQDGKDDQGQALTHSDKDQQEQEWKVAMTQAAQSAKMMGQLPAGVARMVEEWVNPRAPWQELLRQFLEMTARNDYAWCPPSRRLLSQGFYLPSLRSLELPEVVILVDTSGSITQAELDLAAAEITGILEAFETTVHVGYIDAKFQGSQVFTRENLPLRLDAKGCGGTDFRPGFKWVEDQGITPAALIYLTDLDCTRYPSDPGYPVLWARVRVTSRRPPFGEVVEIDQF